MTPAEREKAIIEHIQSHPSCNVEDVVRGVHESVSRVTVFKILHKLIENGAVKNYSENNQKRNARDHRLYVNEGNPLVSVRLELEKFEKAYFDLFDRVSVEFESEHIDTKINVISKEAMDDILELRKRGTESSEIVEHVKKYLENSYDLGYRYGRLLRLLLDIFYSMVDVCLFRFLFIWSQKISDQRVLQQLYSMIFSKIAHMQTRLSESLKKSSQSKDVNKDIERFILERFRGLEGSRPILQYLDSSKKLGMEKEIEPVIDALWNLMGDLQPSVYPEPKLYGWPFKYGEDDWRKLMRLLKQHPESSPYGPDKS